jgi:kinesin family protein 5
MVTLFLTQIEQVFNTIAMSPDNIEFRLKVSIVELYLEKVRDLLDVSKQDLKIRSHAKKGIYIEDVTEKYVTEANELYALMQIGNKNRASCSTNMN